MRGRPSKLRLFGTLAASVQDRRNVDQVPSRTVKVGEEASPRRVFVWALDWPGWCRSGRDRQSALDALEAFAERYAPVAKAADFDFPESVAKFVTVTEVEGGTGTDFGIPSVVTIDDRLAVTPAQAKRLTALVASSWSFFDGVAAAAPEVLRKGPRGGGRDTSKIIAHVDESDSAYAREIGIKNKPPVDRAEIEAIRAAIVEILGRPSNGEPLAMRKWPQRYAARRIAWHALDHAWEIEDRSQ